VIIIIVVVIPVVLAAKKPDVTVTCGYSLCRPIGTQCPDTAQTPGVNFEFLFTVKNNAISDGNGKISQLILYDLDGTQLSSPGSTGSYDFPKNSETKIWGTNFIVYQGANFWAHQVYNVSNPDNYSAYTVRLKGTLSATMSTFDHTINIDTHFTFPTRPWKATTNGTCPY